MTTAIAVPAKRWRYRVTAIDGKNSTKGLKVGTVLLYNRNNGVEHTEVIVNTKTFKPVCYWHMIRLGPCWLAGKKVYDTKAEADKALRKTGKK